jgi:hypothetical protein
METKREQESMYGHTYNSTRSMIFVLSGVTAPDLEDMATELQADYELFICDYRGPYLPDAHVGFAEMMRHWPTPWAVEGSCLNDLPLPQFFLAWAWNQNEIARYLLDGESITSGWAPRDAVKCGVVAAISAAKSLSHARLLMATAAT